MKSYIDTSVLASVYCAEPASLRCEKALQSCSPVISRLTCLEFSSAVAKKLRTKEIRKADATRVITTFHDHIRAGVFSMIAVGQSDYVLATEWIDSFTTALRTMDALHTAIAVSGDLQLVTLDKALARSAKTLGAKVLVP